MVILHCRGVLMEGRNVVDYMYLATSTRIGQAEISNKFNTVLTFFQTSDFFNVHGNKLILWSLLQITTTHTLAIREYYTIEIMLSEI